MALPLVLVLVLSRHQQSHVLVRRRYETTISLPVTCAYRASHDSEAGVVLVWQALRSLARHGYSSWYLIISSLGTDLCFAHDKLSHLINLTKLMTRILRRATTKKEGNKTMYPVSYVPGLFPYEYFAHPATTYITPLSSLPTPRPLHISPAYLSNVLTHTLLPAPRPLHISLACLSNAQHGVAQNHWHTAAAHRTQC